jgi:hypothetical protein
MTVTDSTPPPKDNKPLLVFISSKDNPSPGPRPAREDKTTTFYSTLSEAMPNKWTVKELAYADQNNQYFQFFRTDRLFDHHFTEHNTTGGYHTYESNTSKVTKVTNNDFFSITQEFVIYPTTTGSSTDTITTLSAPGPDAGAGLPGLAVAGAGLLAWRLRRRRRIAFASSAC